MKSQEDRFTIPLIFILFILLTLLILTTYFDLHSKINYFYNIYPRQSYINIEEVNRSMILGITEEKTGYLLFDWVKGNVIIRSRSADEVFEHAVKLLAPTGGSIIVNPGTYTLTKPLTLGSKISLKGNGFPTLVFPANSDGIVISEDSSYVEISGLIIRGSKESRSGALLRIKKHGFTIRIANLELFSHYDGIIIEGGMPPKDFWGIIISGVHVHDMSNNGLVVKGYGNVLYVKESNIANSGNACIVLEDTADGVMEFNNIHCFNSGKYSVLAYNTQGGYVQHKRFVHCNLEGIDMRPETSRFTNCINIAFIDVEIAGMRGNGLELINCRDVRIIGGRIINNSIGSPLKYSGIYLKDSRNVLIQGVFIYDFSPPGQKTQGFGIYEDGSSDYNIFQGNVLSGNGLAALKVSGTHSIVQGNIEGD